MTIQTNNPLSAAEESQSSRKPAAPSRVLRWFNGGAHAITGIVLIYAFIFNGETAHAMISPVAMTGEVNLGLLVGFLFLIRFIWVRSKVGDGGRWTRASLRPPSLSAIRQITDWSIYLGVAATVISGLLIAYLRPGVQIIPGNRFFLTRSPALNAAIRTHVLVVTALEWLCAFHVAYFLWFWKIRKTRWGKTSEVWLARAAPLARRAGLSRFRGREFQ
jgi:hypothetical protein